REVTAPSSRDPDAGPNHFDLFVLIKHHMADKEYLEAETVSRHLLDRFGESISERERANAQFLLAGALVGRRRFDEAVEAFKAAAALDPQDGVVFYKLGQCYERMELWAEAQGAFEQAVALNSARPEYAE